MASAATQICQQEASTDLLDRVRRNKPADLTPHQRRSVLLMRGYINRAECDHASQTQLFPIELFLTLFAYAYCKPLRLLQKERKALLESKVTTRRQCAMRTAIECDIVLEISNRNFSRIDDGGKSQQTLLTEILSVWIGEERLSSHIRDIDVATQMCITNDNARILPTMLQHTLNDAVYSSEYMRNRVMMEHISLATRCGSMECLAHLLGEPESLNWTGQLRDPECLLIAVELHAHNLKVAHFIIDRLEKLNLRLDCADIMEAVIERDLVDIARRLMNNDWYAVTAQDEMFARGKCKALFREKLMVKDIFMDNCETLMIDDKDWDGAEDFSDIEDEEML